MPGIRLTASGRISKAWPPPTNQYNRPQGLHNPGMLCYRRALLQCLLHAPAFYNFLGMMHPRCEKPATQCVVCALQGLALKYWTDRSTANFTRAAVGILDKAVLACCQPGNEFYPFRTAAVQADPADFFRFLDAQCRASGLDHRLDELFQLQHIRTGQCTVCGTASDTVRDIPDLATTMSMVHMTGPDGTVVSCAVCKQNDPTSGDSIRAQTLKIAQAPHVLVVQIARFWQVYAPDGKFVREEKRTNPVPFEEVLDLTEFTEDGSQLQYRLHGVVAHQGLINDGHYVAAVRHHDDDGFTVVNDDSLRQDLQGGFREMRRPTVGSRSFTPYMLVYQRLDEVAGP
ncbi:hypothetical protein LTR53_001072 [Teratosphaeriaceae sp. CCFEE 6253]|nr:hypothetical protein LTR53_001072 [Teratosphaeriaceae sp. CCFEE 6253]